VSKHKGKSKKLGAEVVSLAAVREEKRGALSSLQVGSWYSGRVVHALGRKLSSSKCAYTHRPLPLGNGRHLFGGSCSDPVFDGCDVYVGLDRWMQADAPWPWEPPKSGPTRVKYEITDGHKPSDPKSFHRMVLWLVGEIQEGRAVHVGCIGGHGRTGMLLAALVSVLEIDPDPIKYVRENYCKHAVETKEQIAFLVERYACKAASPSTRSYKGRGHGEHWGNHDRHWTGYQDEFERWKPLNEGLPQLPGEPITKPYLADAQEPPPRGYVRTSKGFLIKEKAPSVSTATVHPSPDGNQIWEK